MSFEHAPRSLTRSTHARHGHELLLLPFHGLLLLRSCFHELRVLFELLTCCLEGLKDARRGWLTGAGQVGTRGDDRL